MQEADQGDQKKNEGKQGKQHLVGECRCVSRHFVVKKLVDRAKQYPAQRQSAQIRKEHSVSLPPMVVSLPCIKGTVAYFLHQTTLVDDRKVFPSLAGRKGPPSRMALCR
ncbi:hypothetical protein D3C80_770400 [compost metagenome]